ncbi:hypothetical protein ACHAWC_002180 [Mediolabrus comicus]
MGIKEYLDEQDVSSSDVAPFLIIHTVLSAILVSSTWWLCYSAASFASPEQSSLMMSLGIDKMPRSALLNSLVAMPFISDDVKRRAVSSLAALEKTSRNSKLVAFLERKMSSLDATRLCVSYAEAKLGRLFFKPFTIPARIWLSWKGTKLWQQQQFIADGEERTRRDNIILTRTLLQKNNNHNIPSAFRCTDRSLKSTFIDDRTNCIILRKKSKQDAIIKVRIPVSSANSMKKSFPTHC